MLGIEKRVGENYTCIKIISAPHSAKATAAACPIPLVPPVTSAVCPSRENIAIVAEAAIVAFNSVLWQYVPAKSWLKS